MGSVRNSKFKCMFWLRVESALLLPKNFELLIYPKLQNRENKYKYFEIVNNKF